MEEEFLFFWEAWHRLQYDRQYGAMGGESPISFVAIDRFAARHGIEGTEFDILEALMREMDDEYLAHLDERRKADEAERKARENNRS